MIVSALTTTGMGLTSLFTIHLLLRLIGGAASAYVIVLGSTLVLERLAAAGRPDLSAMHFSGVGTGIMVSAAAVSLLQTAIGPDWEALWMWSGAIAMAATIAIVLLIPPDDRADAPAASAERTTSAPVATTLPTRSRNLFGLVLAYGLFGFGYVITATFLVTIVRKNVMRNEHVGRKLLTAHTWLEDFINAYTV